MIPLKLPLLIVAVVLFAVAAVLSPVPRDRIALLGGVAFALALVL